MRWCILPAHTHSQIRLDLELNAVKKSAKRGKIGKCAMQQVYKHDHTINHTQIIERRKYALYALKNKNKPWLQKRAPRTLQTQAHTRERFAFSQHSHNTL